MSRLRTGAADSGLTDTTSAVETVDHVAGLGLDPQRRADLEQVPDDVAHRRHRPAGRRYRRLTLVPTAGSSGTGRQCPNGSGSSPGVQLSPGTPQPLDFTVRFAARACRPISLSM